MSSGAVGFNDAGFVSLGAANPSSIKRFANFTQEIINSGEPIPRSRFARYVAERITDPDDKQDFLASVSGGRGSGKSYSCLWIMERISEEIALILGGTPKDYFNPKTNVIALEDAQCVSEILNNKTKYQCILIDDASVGLNSHDWNSKANKNFIKICTTMRTRRWCIIVNSPLNKNLDNSLRDFIQVQFYIAGSFHKGGFNILRANLNRLTPQGKIYLSRLKFDGHRIDMWAAFKPDKKTVDEYDRVREESAIRLNELIAATGSSVRQAPKKSRAEQNAEQDLQKHGDAVKKAIADNPQISVRQLAAKLCLSGQSTERLLCKMDIKLIGKPIGRPKAGAS